MTYRDGYPDFSDFADTKHTGLAKRGDVYVELTGVSSKDIDLATKSLAQDMGVTQTQLKQLIGEKDLVWHHTVEFIGDLSGPGKGAKVRMVLVPRAVHNAAKDGAVHAGGHAVYVWHWNNGIP